MRQFFIATGASMKTGALNPLTDLAKGQLAFAVSGDGDIIGLAASDTTVLESHKRFQLLLGDVDMEGQKRPAVVPIYAHHMSYSVMGYQPAKTFSAKVTIEDPDDIGTYTLIIVKKGIPFNERNKWSHDIYVRNIKKIDKEALAAKLVDAINGTIPNNPQSTYYPSGVIATLGGAANNEITITAINPAMDYEIVLADCLMENGSAISAVTHAEVALADTAMIIDLASKCIADAGINDTYQEASEYMHPRYPITKGQASLAAEYDVVTLRFAEPREMKTRDDIVHQIVQIAFARTSSGTPLSSVQEFTDILDKLGAAKVD